MTILPKYAALAAMLAAFPAAPALADAYVAVSTTAMSITGDIELDDDGIRFANGEKLAFSSKVSDAIEVDGEEIEASVFEVTEPSDPLLENGNRLCGQGDVTYIATWRSQFDLTTVAVFTTLDAPSSDAEMCASYSYD